MSDLQTRAAELIAPRHTPQIDVADMIVQDIDRSFAGRSGHACLGYIEGNPLVDPMRQEWFYLPTQRTTLITRVTELESQYGDVYISQCLFQRLEEFGPKGRSIHTVARD